MRWTLYRPTYYPSGPRLPRTRATQLYYKVEQLVKIADGKNIVIGETRNLSDGAVKKGFQKTAIVNAATIFQDFYDLVQKRILKSYCFAVIGETWKLSSTSTNSSIDAYFRRLVPRLRLWCCRRRCRPRMVALATPCDGRGCPDHGST